MKILTLWLWAFWFAVNKLLAENNSQEIFYAYELNSEVVTCLKQTRKHPFFFEWYTLPDNVEVLDSYDDIIWEVDVLILAIPAQFISRSIDGFKDKIKSGIIIMNLAKGIDIFSNTPISTLLKENISTDFQYAVLSWGMIAQEVVEWAPLGADLWIQDFEIGKQLQSLLQNNNFTVQLCKDYLNIELYGSLKNIMAILAGYYEGKGYKKSTVGYYLVNFYDEMKNIIKLYGWNPEIDFSYYSLGWDIVATCFGNSRNRYFWKLLWEWKSIWEVLDILKSENKHAEWYETLKAVYPMVQDKQWFEIIKFLYWLIEEKK